MDHVSPSLFSLLSVVVVREHILIGTDKQIYFFPVWRFSFCCSIGPEAGGGSQGRAPFVFPFVVVGRLAFSEPLGAFRLIERGVTTTKKARSLVERMLFTAGGTRRF